MEIMSLKEAPWNDTHHCSSLFPNPMIMSSCLENLSSRFPTQSLQMTIMTNEVWLEENMGIITQMMPIDISVKLGIIENFHIAVPCSLDEIKFYTHPFQEFQDVFAWSYEKIPRIDPTIVVHKVPTYPNAKPIINTSSSVP